MLINNWESFHIEKSSIKKVNVCNSGATIEGTLKAKNLVSGNHNHYR